MASPYNNASTYGGDRISSAFPTRLNAATDRYSDASLLASSKYLTSDPAAAKASHFSIQADGNIAAAVTFPNKFAGEIGAPAVDLSSAKRPAEALYHQPILGTQNAMGQSEALFSAHTFAKYPRFETASNLHKYPQRPGEKDCSHYMLTRTCNFGANCKFDHPLWVPEGGISGWKEIPVIDDTCGPPPERPGEPDCLYYMKTQRCKFGSRCKFNHPKVTMDASASGVVGEGLQTLSAGQNSVSMDNEVAGGDTNPTKLLVPFTPAFLHNSKGLPVRPGETDCPFYLKTGSCKYGAVCRYNHPDRNLISPQVPAALGQVMIPPPATNLPLGVLNPAANLLPSMDPRLTQAQIAVAQTICLTQNIYPQRPGELECDHYMKFGQCKFGERCKFHHPIDRVAPISQEQNVKLTLAGLPRRECTVACPYYMKTGACNYGVKCRFDHPTPGEAVAMAAVQGIASPEEEEEEEEEDTADDSPVE